MCLIANSEPLIAFGLGRLAGWRNTGFRSLFRAGLGQGFRSRLCRGVPLSSEGLVNKLAK